MGLKLKRTLFFAVWIFLVITPVITIFRSVPSDHIFSDPLVLANVFQRLSGMLAYVLIFTQLILGSFMNTLVQFIGARAYRLHTFQGLIAYGFIFIHPLFQSAIIYQTSKSIVEALLVILPQFKTQRDLYLVYGKIAFLLTTIAVLASYFRTNPFFRRNWRVLHRLNFLAFYFVFLHSGIGKDIDTFPFSFIRFVSFISVSSIVLLRFVYPSLIKYLKIGNKIFYIR